MTHLQPNQTGLPVASPDAAAPAAWQSADIGCAALLVARDWAQTPLGPMVGWPKSLKTMVAFVFASRVPMVMLWGPAGTMIYNDAYSLFAGQRHPELFGQEVRKGWPEVADFNANVMAVGLAGGTLSFVDQELTLYRNGVPEQVFMNLDYSPVPGDDGNPAGVLAIVIETTQRVAAERQRALAESEASAARDRARDVVENMTEGLVLLDRDFRVLEINAEGLRLEQRPAADIIGKSYWEIWPAAYSGELGRLYRRAMAERVPVGLEHRYFWDDGRSAWLDMRAYPTAEGLAIFYKDVTKRHEAIAMAAVAAERVQIALESGTIVGTWVWDMATGTYAADARFADTFGFDRGISLDALTVDMALAALHPDDRDAALDALTRVLADGGVFRREFRVRQTDGTFRWIEGNGRTTSDPDGAVSGFSGVLLDVDARRVAESARDRANALLRTFADAVPGVVYAKDRDGRLLVANRGTSELLGMPPEAYLGKTDAEVLDDKAQAEAVMATDRRIMETGVTEQVEEHIRRPDGTPSVWLSTKSPLRADSGEVIGIVGSSIDITARIDAEKALAEALRTSDILLHEVNHRVKNSLQIVTSLLMLQANQAKDGPLRQSLMDARSRIAVIADLHQRLYATSQHDSVEFGGYIRDLARETLGSLQDAGRIRFEADVESGIDIALGPAVSLALVVNELVTNAVKYAFPDDRPGRVILACRRTPDCIILSVADDGVGMPGDFDPGKPTGLGMRIVTSLVRQVRGTLDIGDAAPGTVFVISLPVEQVT